MANNTFNNLVQKSTTQSISNVFYYDIIDKKYIGDDTEINDAIERFRKAYKKGECLYIRHKGENGDSDHIHLILRNNTKKGFENVQNLRNDIFYQLSKVNTERYNVGDVVSAPLFSTSSNGDWLGYALHSKEYFEKKKIPFDKQFTYTIDDVKGNKNFLDDCERALKEILNEQEKETDIQIIVNGIKQGLTDYEIIESLPYVNSTNLYCTIKGIEKMRKLVSPDLSDFDIKLNELVPYFDNHYYQCHMERLSDKINLYKEKDGQRVFLPKGEILKIILKQKILEITQDDILSVLCGK